MTKELFVKAQLSKTQCYVGEPLVVTYKLYSAVNGTSKLVREITKPGLSQYPLSSHPDLNASTEVYLQKKFQVHTIKKAALIPQVAGMLEVNELEMLHKVYLTKRKAAGEQKGIDDLIKNITDEEFSSRYVTITSKSMPATLKVVDLPHPTPPGFSGAIGQFSVRGNIESRQIKVGDALKMVVAITGFGNLEGVEAPALILPAGMETMSVQKLPDALQANQLFAVERKFEYTIIASQAQSSTIPPIRFNYFDPARKMYRVTETLPLKVSISGQKTVAQHMPVSGKGHSSGIVVIASVIMTVGVAWLLKTRRKRAKFIALPIPAGTIEDKLSTIEQQVATGDLASFHSLNNLLWDTLSTSLQLKPTELNRKNILGELDRRGWNDVEKSHVETLINAYEEYLYIPGMKKVPDLTLSYHQTKELLLKLRGA